MIVLLNAMIPAPGETPGQWWDNTGSGKARRAADEAVGRSGEFGVETYFLHDLPPSSPRLRPQPEDKQPGRNEAHPNSSPAGQLHAAPAGD